MAAPGAPIGSFISALAADLAVLAAKNPDIVRSLYAIVRAAVTAKNPWRAIIRRTLAEAGKRAGEELADELAKLKKPWE